MKKMNVLDVNQVIFGRFNPNMNKTEDYSEILKDWRDFLEMQEILFKTEKDKEEIEQWFLSKLKTIEEGAREATIKELTENALNKTQPDYQFFGKARSKIDTLNTKK